MMRLVKGRNLWIVLFSGLLLLVVGAFLLYQNWIKPPLQEEVDRAVVAKDWGRVASLLEKTNLAADDGSNYFKLGQALFNLGRDEQAVAAFREADDRNYRRSEARFLIASIYAKSGQKERAAFWLRDAIESGFADLERVSSDPYLSKVSLPSAGNDEVESTTGDSLTGLDFLIGTWNVTSGANFSGGSVTFSKVIPGVMVTESWSGTAPGGSTASFLYDKETQSWRYSSVDGYGRVFRGPVKVGEKVEINGTMTYMDGVPVERRIEIDRSAGAIDYVVSDSRDGGRTWDDAERRRLTVPSDTPRPNF